MREYVYCNPGQEKKFISRAKALHWPEICFIYSKKDISQELKKIKLDLLKNTQIKVFFGFLKETATEFVDKSIFDEILQLGTKNSTLFKQINILYDNESETEKDFIHQRRSGLNQVVLTECKKKKITILFDYSSLQRVSFKKKILVLGRIQQNISLCKKYAVACSFASFAKNIDDLRDAKDIQALQRQLGL